MLTEVKEGSKHVDLVEPCCLTADHKRECALFGTSNSCNQNALRMVIRLRL